MIKFAIFSRFIPCLVLISGLRDTLGVGLRDNGCDVITSIYGQKVTWGLVTSSYVTHEKDTPYAHIWLPCIAPYYYYVGCVNTQDTGLINAQSSQP